MEKEQVNYKIIILFVVVIVCVCLFSFFVSPQSDDDQNSSYEVDKIIANAQKESEAIPDNEKKDFPSITVDEYLQMYEGSENQIILLASPNCSYCQIAEPIIRHLAYQYDINISYLNPDEFKGNDKTKFIQSDEMFSEGYGTPFLFIVSSSKIVDKIDGLTDTQHYQSFFKQHGYIK